MTKHDILELEERAGNGCRAATMALADVERAPRQREAAAACKAKSEQLRKLRREMYAADYERLVRPIIEALRRAGNRLARAATQALKRARQLKAFEVVPNEPFRERFLSLERRGLIDASAVARRGKFGKTVKGQLRVDTSWVLRLLGLRPPAASTKTNSDGERVDYHYAPTTVISYDLGVRMADALTLPYPEAGV